MQSYLAMKLQGPMQAWGHHTFEGTRPSLNAPTRSAVLGLIGACMGIRRNQRDDLQCLDASLRMAVRADGTALLKDDADHARQTIRAVKITDYHTVIGARDDYTGLKSLPNPIQTWREYICDATFTAVLWGTEGAQVSLEQIEAAIKQPIYTPYLGRRSCPLARPLFEKTISAENATDALAKVPPAGGEIYSEEFISGATTVNFRDQPLYDRPRQFDKRMVFVSGGA